MTLLQLIRRTLLHYPGSSLAAMAGIAISTAIITGALVVGDSLRHSLEKVVDYRLGGVTHTVTAGERLFTVGFADGVARAAKAGISDETGVVARAAKAGTSDETGVVAREPGAAEAGMVAAAPVLKTEAVVTFQESNLRINKVQLWGVGERFREATGFTFTLPEPGSGEAVISYNLAQRLQADTGDFLLVRMRYTGPIPANTPFVSDERQTISRRIRIKAIAGMEQGGQFNLQTSQTAPYNMFVGLDWLNRAMELEGNANMVLIGAGSATDDHLSERLQDAWQPADGALKLEYLADSSAIMLTSGRVFLDDHVADVVSRTFPGARQHLTYFVNSLALRNRLTPYSFVTAGSDYRHLRHNEMVINAWLAADLNAVPGDTLVMRYYEIGPLRELVEREAAFVVAGIMPMEESQADAALMPDLPGLSDAGSCSQWEAGIPIDLEAIRQKDEDYWDAYRGTPKAYISLARGQELWRNRFGSLTSVTFAAGSHDMESLSRTLSENIDPVRLEFRLNAVREHGLRAAGGGVDFAGLFAGLGMFIIISGLMLTWLLARFSMERRRDQIMLYTSLGFPKRLVRRILLGEALLVVTAASIIGAAIAIAYSKLVFAGLNTLWHDIVRTNVLVIRFHPVPIMIGIMAGIAVGGGVMLLAINRFMASHLQAAKAQNKPFTFRTTPFRATGIMAKALLLVSAILISYLGMGGHFQQPLSWMVAGVTLLGALLLFAHQYLFSSGTAPSPRLDSLRLSWRNLRRNPLRSFTVITLLALGTFVIIVTASNRKDLNIDPGNRAGGTGGFALMAETTMPVLSNLNQESIRRELGIPENVSFVQFMSVYDDDASCLNLNRVENPRLIATDPALLEGRFSFATRHQQGTAGEPWSALTHDHGDAIPGIADQTVIRWGLGKQPGDTLIYLNAEGQEVKVVLIAGLENSIFQGNVIISADNLLKHFPATSGSNVFLIELSGYENDLNNNPEDDTSNPGQTGALETSFSNDLQAISEELSFIFRDFGWEMQPAAEKLAAFNTVENTYLRIFFLLGAFGMLLGTAGLAVIIARSLLERQKETSLFKALGFKMIAIMRIYFTEYVILLITGILTGTITALLATLPTFLAASQNVSNLFLASVIAAILLNGMFWIALIPAVMVRSRALSAER